MLELWSVIALMLVFASALLVWPLVKFKGCHQATAVSQKQENILIFQERLSELESEKMQGNLAEATFEHLKTELEKSLLGDVQEEELINSTSLDKANTLHWMIMGLVISVFVVASLLTYQHLGASKSYSEYLALGGEKAAVLASDAESQKAAPDFAQAVRLLKAKLAENPEDIEKWFLLANSYTAMGNFKQAANVFNKISGLVGQKSPDYPAIKAAYAQAMYQVAGEKMTPEVQQAIDEVLSLDAQEPTALILQGLDAYTHKQYAQAIAFWEKAKINAGKTQVTQFIEPAIQEARRQSGEIAVAKVQTSQKEQAGVGVTVKLSINSELKAKVNPNTRVFVFAKANRPMPLAAERLQVKDLPITLVLDDSKAAMPTAKISSVDFVDITARIALSGSPRAVKGDFYATAKHIAVKQGAKVSLVINQVVK